MRRIGLIISFGILLGIISCSDDGGPGSTGDNFDRQAMLINWADNIILPSYQAYVADLATMKSAAETFTTNLSTENLESLRTAWLDAYTSWQWVAMFEIGKAEELTLLNFTNVYPVNVSDMEVTIASGTFTLESVNKQDEQGFPAVDYLINGLAATDAEIVDAFTQSENYGNYLITLVTRLDDLANEVNDDWNNGYRDTFLESSGSDATSSVNKLANDVLFHYEKHLRAGKIGIPAGVFSGGPLADHVEALYSQGSSRVLFESSVEAFKSFFNGEHFTGGGSGESFRSYLEFLNTITDGEDLGQLINNNLDAVLAKVPELDTDFESQVNSNNNAMLETYDLLQVNVPLMKVDMFQAMNIVVDFVDADGD